MRGFEDYPALEAYSNELAPCIKTIMGFTLIVEPNKMNKRLEQLIQDGTVSGKHGEYIDCRSMITRDNVSGTITTTVNNNCNFVVVPSDKVPPQENTMQNYAVERKVLNATTTLTTAHHYSGNIIDPKRGQKEMGVLEILTPDKDGNARTISTHYADMNAESVTRKSGDGYGYVRTAVKEPSFRIRKLTNRECFRLMGVDDADIDKIQAADISKSQQYKLAGNSIVVDVLAAIFRKMFIDKNDESSQLSLF